MGKKKEPSIADAVSQIKDVMNRCLLTDYLYMNSKIISKSNKGYSVIIIPDSELWSAIVQDKEILDKMRELDLKNPNDAFYIDTINYADNITEESWIDLDAESMYNGKILKVKVTKNYEYDIPINRDLLPLKLKKAEYNNISYKVFSNFTANNKQSLCLGIKKYFNYPLDDTGFYIMRVFKIL